MYIRRTRTWAGLRVEVIIVLVPVIDNSILAVHAYVNVGSRVVRAEYAVVVFRRQCECRCGSIRSRGARSACSDNFSPQRLASWHACNDVDDGVPESLEWKHHPRDKVQSKDQIVRMNQSIHSVYGRRDPKTL